MLRKFLDFQLALTEKGKPLHKLRPLISAGDTFFYEPAINTRSGPHIRDAVDLKRWMILVVFALLPCILMAMWNTGMQKIVYGSGDYHLLDEYLAASTSLSGYFSFAFQGDRWIEILKIGALAFLPVMVISYAVGGLCEGIFACIRGHEIAEGFLVTGMLYPLILPPQIPYWMVAVGVAVGVILSKELFGGTGMNIMNPAICCRAFLFFTFPGKMSGDVWVGTNPTRMAESLAKMNKDAGLSAIDGYTQASPLSTYSISTDIKRVHVDAIAASSGHHVDTSHIIDHHLSTWSATSTPTHVADLTTSQLQSFVTAPVIEGGLGLPPDQYASALHFSNLRYNVGHGNDANFFFGNQFGSMGETSTLFCLLGAFFLIWMGIGSWRKMLAMGLGAYATALLFQWGAKIIGIDGGAWNPAKFDFPAYKHLIIGGLAFGAVFMVTDPVSSPSVKSAMWIYGLFVGMLTICIREINPAYPEGVMLAIMMGNVFSPLIEHYAVRKFRRKRRVPIQA